MRMILVWTLLLKIFLILFISPFRVYAYTDLSKSDGFLNPPIPFYIVDRSGGWTVSEWFGTENFSATAWTFLLVGAC